MGCNQIGTALGGALGRLTALGRKLAFLSILVWCVITAPDTRAEIRIFYRADDLADAIAGEDLWRYSYTVTGRTFAAFEGFKVYFPTQFFSVVDISAIADGWDAVLFVPDEQLPDQAFLAQALADSAPPQLFAVEFLWLGGQGSMPGSQRYELFDADFNVLVPPGTLGTLLIPEPRSGLLLLAGLALLAAMLMRRPAERGASCSR